MSSVTPSAMMYTHVTVYHDVHTFDEVRGRPEGDKVTGITQGQHCHSSMARVSRAFVSRHDLLTQVCQVSVTIAIRHGYTLYISNVYAGSIWQRRMWVTTERLVPFLSFWMMTYDNCKNVVCVCKLCVRTSRCNSSPCGSRT